MKSKLMAISVLLLLALTVAPAMAIGPQKAEKNPHITITPEGAMLLLPSGVQNEWMADTEIGVMDFVHILDASKGKGKAKIRAVPLTIEDLMQLMTNETAALEAENMWGYIPHDVFVELLVFMGYPEIVAEAIAATWPDGIYAKFVNVGK